MLQDEELDIQYKIRALSKQGFTSYVGSNWGYIDKKNLRLKWQENKNYLSLH